MHKMALRCSCVVAGVDIYFFRSIKKTTTCCVGYLRHPSHGCSIFSERIGDLLE
jgi:hypothetical protein